MVDYAYLSGKRASISLHPSEEDRLMAQRHRLESKRSAAKEWLGDRWILHPDYVYQPKHAWRVGE